MDKIFVGLDISLNSTGITYLDGDTTGFINFFNIHNVTSAKKPDIGKIIAENKLLSGLSNLSNLSLQVYTRKPSSAKTKGLNDWHIAHIEFCMFVSQQISVFLHKANSKKKEMVINIENYSYGSVGSADYQLAEFGGMIKLMLINEGIVTPNNLYVTPGPTIKTFVGKGNYDKYDMLHVYNELPKTSTDQFGKFIKTNFDDLWFNKVTGKGSNTRRMVHPPISDIIDSYWIAKYLRDVICTEQV